MGHTHLAGTRPAPTAHQPGMADGVVGCAEGTAADQRPCVAQFSSHGIDAGDIQRFRDGQPGQNGGQGAGEEGLARTGRPFHQQIVAARAGDLQRPFYVLLAFDIPKVDEKARCVVVFKRKIIDVGGNRLASVQVVDQPGQAVDGIDGHALHQRGFGRVTYWHKEALEALLLGHRGHRQNPVHVAHIPVQTQLAHNQRILQIGQQLARGGHHPQRDGQVIGRAFLADVRRGQVDGQPGLGEVKAAVADGRAHPFPALAHSRVGQADDSQLFQSIADVHFHLHRRCIQPDDCATLNFGKH